MNSLWNEFAELVLDNESLDRFERAVHLHRRAHKAGDKHLTEAIVADIFGAAETSLA